METNGSKPRTEGHEVNKPLTAWLLGEEEILDLYDALSKLEEVRLEAEEERIAESEARYKREAQSEGMER